MQAAHPFIANYVDRHGLPLHALRPDGRLNLLVDEKYRVQMRSGHDGWLHLYSRLAFLPADGIGRDRFLLEIGRMANGMLCGHDSTCVVDAQESALALQQSLRPDSSATDVDKALGEFINALSFWSAAVRRVA